MARRRWSKIAAVLLPLAAAALVMAPTAPAAGEPDRGGFGAFTLKASNGYSMRVFAGSRPGYRKGEALILVARKREGVSYLAPATVTDTKIVVDLGSLGRIAVEFEPTGEKGRAAPRCEPEQQVPYDKGSYVGEVEFHGEEGYTDVSVTSVPFSLHPYIDLICGGYSSGELFGPGLPGARLNATAPTADGSLYLRINQNHPGARVKIEAAIAERHGSIQIAREIDRSYSARVFDFDPMLRTAFVSPPAPFSGSAGYRRAAERRNRWTGNLAVDFPGHSDVSLTGARFEVALRHARLTEKRTQPERSGLAFPR